MHQTVHNPTYTHPCHIGVIKLCVRKRHQISFKLVSTWLKSLYHSSSIPWYIIQFFIKNALFAVCSIVSEMQEQLFLKCKKKQKFCNVCLAFSSCRFLFILTKQILYQLIYKALLVIGIHIVWLPVGPVLHTYHKHLVILINTVTACWKTQRQTKVKRWL